jgi:hypothetical protein
LLTANVCCTAVAALYVSSPVCEAVMVVVPPPTIVMVFPETVATAAFELLYVTASPELAVAARSNGLSPNVLVVSDPKVMLCASLIPSPIKLIT